ncbi:hypothetical protein LCGC14_0575920 [marine sediment metagenome]|uniref:Uncharacterized protein n=1 Tax=marine sediment metagenome TaxID=412755 RepID=A0A0F9UR52_9ZZZZ
MSKVQTQLQRTRSFWKIKLSVRELYAGNYDSLTIQFRDNNGNILEVLQTSSGSILEDRVTIDKKISEIEIDILHKDNLRQIEGVLAYFKQGNIIHCETTSTLIPAIPVMSKNIFEIKTSNIKGISKWKVEIKVKDDIILSIVTAGPSPTLMVFGDSSQTLSHTDVIYSVYPTIDTIIIPKELIWYKYNDYVTTELGCYELIRPDCHKIENLYYKIPSSELVDVSRLPKPVKQELSNFRTPVGGAFNPEEWSIGNLGLPVRSDK